MSTPDGQKLCRAMLLLSTLDLPAKAAVVNVKQWNGEYGCSVCVAPGDNSLGGRSSRHWPYRGDTLLRTHGQMIANGKEALKRNKPVSFTITLSTIIKNVECTHTGIGS